MYQHDNKSLTEASKDNPCPICSKTDWCFVGDEIAICGRVDVPPHGWKQIKTATDGRPVFKQETPEIQTNKKVININRNVNIKKVKPAPIPQIKLCELPADRERSPQPVESALLRKPKKAGENAHSFEDITYRYSDSQWVTRTQWLDPEHPKGRDKTYCQWHLDNGKAIAKKGEKVWPAYRIEEAISALCKPENGRGIILVEGEPNVETVRSLGLASITLMGSSWQTDAIEDALITLTLEAQPPVIIDLIESDKPGLGKKDRFESVCAARSIPYVRLFPSELWPEKPLEIPTDTADITDLVAALGADEVRRRLEQRLSEIPTSEAEAEEDEEEGEEEQEPGNIFNSKLNRKRVLIERGIGHRLSYNEFKKRIELDDEPICEDLDDQGGAKLFIAERLDIDIADADAVAILNRAAKKRRYHPVRDYLEECATRYGRDAGILDGIALRYFGTPEPIHQSYLVKHLIGSVKRIFEPGCKHDSMLILKGEQGVRKSTWFRVLYGDENFTDSVLGTEERDSLMALTLYWACEYGEFETITSKKDVSQLKSWLARNKDDYRAPYAKTVKAHPRTFVLVGSTNRDDFLRDETGSRRFMVIPVLLPTIPVERLLEERDRIWGAAVALYRAGVSSDLSRVEMQLQKVINEDYSQVDPWTEIISAYVADFPSGEFISTKTLLEKAIGLEPKQMDTQSTRRCSAIMTQMGWTKQRRRQHGIQQSGFVAPVQDEDNAIAQHPAQPQTRYSQAFEPPVQDVQVKNYDELFSASAQENEGDRLEEISNSSEIEIEKVQSEKHPAHPAQEAETIANNEFEAVQDVPIANDTTSCTEELKVGMRIAIVGSDAWNGEKGTIARAKKWMGRVEYWFVAMDKGGERKYESKFLRKIDEPKEELTQLDLLSSANLEPGDYLEDAEEGDDDQPTAAADETSDETKAEENGPNLPSGTRIRNKRTAATGVIFKETEHCYEVRWDAWIPKKNQEHITGKFECEALEAFQKSIKEGDRLKALKHPDHKDFYLKKSNHGKVEKILRKGKRIFATVSTNEGIRVFNLEAVEVCDE